MSAPKPCTSFHGRFFDERKELPEVRPYRKSVASSKRYREVQWLVNYMDEREELMFKFDEEYLNRP